MAAAGVRFINFFVSWPACTPSRGSILTGRYPQRNGLYEMIRNNEVNWGFRFDEKSYAISPEMTLGLDLREFTIAQALKQAGYKYWMSVEVFDFKPDGETVARLANEYLQGVSDRIADSRS